MAATEIGALDGTKTRKRGERRQNESSACVFMSASSNVCQGARACLRLMRVMLSVSLESTSWP